MTVSDGETLRMKSRESLGCYWNAIKWQERSKSTKQDHAANWAGS
jgi:hypothetical protein